MGIIINKDLMEFHLTNSKISYIFNILENGQLGQLYYGSRITHRNNFNTMLHIDSKENVRSPYIFKEQKGFSLELLKQEYPAYGTGDYKEPAIVILQENGSRITNFTYSKYSITSGKHPTSGLPGVYTESDSEAEHLKIHLYDEAIGAELILSYTIFEEYPAIIRSATLVNHSQTPLIIERLLSASIDFDDEKYRVTHLSGAWARENHVYETDLTQSKFVIESKQGTSSPNNNPFIALHSENATEHCGNVYGFSLIYSGNFIAQIEKNMIDIVRVNMGINPFNFSWNLEPNGEFATPEVVMVFSNTGFNGMSQTFHKLYRQRLARGMYRDLTRPVLINNWEATYFDFDEEKLLSIAKKSADLGVELFVLDDGWFGARNNDKQGLGDWTVNYDKIPSGIGGLAEKIENLGMKFGLWFEPEMVNKDSELYRLNPEWTIHVPQRLDTECRNQCVLDMGREDVQEYLATVISNILSSAKISYVKWDMNRPLTEIYSSLLPSHRQGEVAHRYVLGLYRLLERIVSEFPEILFESCASGGGRFDPGMLYYMPQAWASDNTDAIERIKIQYGTSMVYPISSIGAHVSAVPNHQTSRITSINTRGNVAFFGAFGYELDLSSLSETEEKAIKAQIVFFKENRTLLQFGNFYRISSPFKDERADTSWISVARDQSRAILAIYTTLSNPNPKPLRIKAKGLNPEAKYRIVNDDFDDQHYFGDELMNAGLIFNRQDVSELGLDCTVGDFQSRIVVLQQF